MNTRANQHGTPDRIRTCDLLLRRQALYPLSYGRLDTDVCELYAGFGGKTRAQLIEHIHGRAHVAPGGVNIGVIKADDGNAILIDTGLNDTAARKVLRELNAEDRQVVAIVTTHGHADHFGGNAFVVKRTGAKVYAPSWDEAVLRYPLFQPLCLFAGADPPASLRSGFMLAGASPVDVVYDAGPLQIEGVEIKAVSLAGHSGNQMGLLIDEVFYCADVVLPDRVIERYKMPYLFSVRDHLKALDRAQETPHLTAVPGHGPTLEHVGGLVDQNRALVLEVADRIVIICREPLMAEEILARLLGELEADPQDAAAYYLLHPTIFAFLTYLEERGDVSHEITGGRSLWRAR
ncbi:MBL fold metallo-hydrolase [soil metagenome]